jgi:hypothetical protein
MVGTVKWKIKDDKGKVHSFILPNTYYSPSVETRLLSPQHWAQTRKKGRYSYCITYHDAIIMRWNKDKYQITAPLDNRKHSNVGVVRSSMGITQYLTACQAIDIKCTTLAYPATICMDYQAAEVTDDEASIVAPKTSQQSINKEMEGIRPVTPTEEEQMREQIFKDKEPEPITYEEEELEEEDLHTYAQDTQEYMQVKPPMCNDCCGARATRKPWRGKGKKHIQKHLKKPSHPRR